ncbi:AfsR/SARP family transcriptional regulator [Dactylosporangium sp. CA-139114]|uniref:AfsR/SARP family transcriptional regulator n=1 Tax=Dactylosporangium sp. CA-139114 TaxID=3239931 RepID=UPI003D9968E6
MSKGLDADATIALANDRPPSSIDSPWRAMRVQLLGPIRVSDGDTAVPLSPQQRVLLAALILSPQQPVEHGYLQIRLWPSGTAGKVNTYQQCITSLRRRMPHNLPKGNQPGYVGVAFDRDDVDYYRFRDAITEAHGQTGTEQVATLRRALAEWQGEALADVDSGYLPAERSRLAAERVKAGVDLLRILQKTDPSAFRRELQNLRRSRPDDITLFEIELRQRINEGDSNLEEFLNRRVERYGPIPARLRKLCDKSRTRPTPPVRERMIPRQLPAYRSTLFGRDAQLAELDQVLLDDDPNAVRRIVITGMPGVGKSQLASYWADHAKASFPDGTFYANLLGYTAPGKPERSEQILARLLNDLGMTPPMPTLDGMISAFRTAMADRRALIVLDNARDARHVGPLLPGNSAGAVIVTSRDRLQELWAHGYQEVWLRHLEPSDARRMISAQIGTARTRGADQELDEIAALCGGLPLALAIVAARVQLMRWETITETAAALRDERTRLDVLEHGNGDLNARAALSASFKVLPRASTRLLGILALHPGPTIGWNAIIALHPSRNSARIARDGLLAANLLEEPAPDRYSLHDLVRIHAAETVQLPGSARARVANRILDYLLCHAYACDRALAPERTLPFEEKFGTEIGAHATVDQAMRWLDDEYQTITAAIRQTHDNGLNRYAWSLALILTTYQWRTGRYADAEQYLRLAAAAARTADGSTRAMIHLALGGSLRGLGRREQAKTEAALAVQLADEADDRLGVARGRQRLGLLYREAGEPQAATEQYELARNEFRRIGETGGEAHALAGLADVRLDVGDLTAALEFGEAARSRFQSTSDSNGYASAIAGLGRIHMARNDVPRAIACLADAVDRYRSLRYVSRLAQTLVALADAQIRALEFEDAREALQQARALFEELDDTIGLHAADARIGALNA